MRNRVQARIGELLTRAAGRFLRRMILTPWITSRITTIAARFLQHHLLAFPGFGGFLESRDVLGRAAVLRLIHETCHKVRKADQALDRLWSRPPRRATRWRAILLCGLVMATRNFSHPANQAIGRVIQRSISDLSESEGTFRPIGPSQPLRVDEVPVFGRNGLDWTYEKRTTAPYVAEVRKGTVHGNCFAVMSEGTLWALSEDARLPFLAANYSSFFSALNREAYASPLLNLNPGVQAERAIHLSTRTAASYFHWMFECLPRILLIDRFPEYAEWPLLVGRDYLPQHYELLELVLQGRRPLLKLGREESIKIDRLVIPSIRSFMPDDPRLRPERSAVDPAAVLELRDALRPASAPPPKNNLLYVSRRKYANARPWTRVRDVANAEQMDRLLQSYGARILHPEEESIENQRLAFHHAGTVVALAGSALANLVFCRPGTRVFILSQEHRVHPSLFTGIAQTLGLRPALITGPGVPDPGPETHWNVRIDPETLKRAILSDAASTELEVAKP